MISLPLLVNPERSEGGNMTDKETLIARMNEASTGVNIGAFQDLFFNMLSKIDRLTELYESTKEELFEMSRKADRLQDELHEKKNLRIASYKCPKCKLFGFPSVNGDFCTLCANKERGFTEYEERNPEVS